jgi:hypothetical protein
VVDNGGDIVVGSVVVMVSSHDDVCDAVLDFVAEADVVAEEVAVMDSDQVCDAASEVLADGSMSDSKTMRQKVSQKESLHVCAMEKWSKKQAR